MTQVPAMRIHLIVAAAGNGTRFGAELPKQYVQAGGVPLITHALRHLCALGALQTVVAIAPGDHEWRDSLVPSGMAVRALRCGGPTRADTVRNALRAIAADCRPDDYVAVHDAVRALTPADSLRRLREALAADAVGGLLALPVADTLKRDDGAEAAMARSAATVPRASLWQAQTPQMFRFAVLAPALAMPDNAACTDEAQAVERAGHAPRLVRGSAYNFKVTLPDDLPLAAAILAAQNA